MKGEIEAIERRAGVRPPGQQAEPGRLPAGSRLPFDRNALFTGREEVLEAPARGLLAGDGDAAIGRATVVTQAMDRPEAEGGQVLAGVAGALADLIET